MKTSIDILDLTKKIYQKNLQLQDVLGETNILDKIIDDLEDIIMTQFGIPDPPPSENFSRDYWAESIFDFLGGELSKEDLIKELRSWKSVVEREGENA